MSEESHGGVRLDVCAVCHGVWFDGGELDAYHAGEGSPGLRGVPDEGAHFRPTGDSAHVKCPRCESDILRTGVISKYKIMRCTTCRGMFIPLPDPRFRTSDVSVAESAVAAFRAIVAAIF